jgi:hypothetical protein
VKPTDDVALLSSEDLVLELERLAKEGFNDNNPIGHSAGYMALVGRKIRVREELLRRLSPKYSATLEPWREPPTHQHGVPFRCGQCGSEMFDGHMCVLIQTPTGSYAKVLDDDRC